jgi:hypothetical protein
MNNVWIVVPVISNDIDLTSYVNRLSGGYTAPETYEKTVFNPLKSKGMLSFFQGSPDSRQTMNRKKFC